MYIFLQLKINWANSFIIYLCYIFNIAVQKSLLLLKELCNILLIVTQSSGFCNKIIISVFVQSCFFSNFENILTTTADSPLTSLSHSNHKHKSSTVNTDHVYCLTGIPKCLICASAGIHMYWWKWYDLMVPLLK